MGEATADCGEMIVGKSVRTALHDQRPPRERQLSLRDYVLSGCSVRSCSSWRRS